MAEAYDLETPFVDQNRDLSCIHLLTCMDVYVRKTCALQACRRLSLETTYSMKFFLSFIHGAFSGVVAFVRSLFTSAVAFVRTTYHQEMEAQRSYWDSWKRDPNLVRRVLHVELYFTFTMPIRLWTLCPSPELLAIVLAGGGTLLAHTWPEYGDLWVAYALIVFGPLCEMVPFCYVWYYVPGGKMLLTEFFYGEKNIELFFGNPGTKLRGLAYSSLTFVVIKMGSVGNDWLNSWSHADQAVREAKAINAMARETLQTFKDTGVEVTKEMVDNARAEAMQKYKASRPTKGWDISAALRHIDGIVSAKVDASHTGNGLNVTGSVVHSSSSKTP